MLVFILDGNGTYTNELFLMPISEIFQSVELGHLNVARNIFINFILFMVARMGTMYLYCLPYYLQEKRLCTVHFGM
jgi:hypothetical protein